MVILRFLILRIILCDSNAFDNFFCRLSGSGKDGQFGRARYSKSPELIETTFSMSTIEEEQEIALSLKSVDG